jgi:hypothetical protein
VFGAPFGCLRYRSVEDRLVGGAEVFARRGYRRGQLADVACAMNVSVLAIGPVVVAIGGCRCGSFSAISIVNSSAWMRLTRPISFAVVSATS